MTLVNPDNVRRIKEDYSRRSVRPESLPAVCVLEATSRCSLNCIMCPQSKLAPENLGDLTIENAEAIAQRISPSAELVMLYFMGEPLEHHDFPGLVAAVRRHILGRIVVSTNCMSLSAENIEALVSAPVDLIVCCIDRWDADEYAKIRRGGQFRTVVSNVEALLRRVRRQGVPRVIVKSLDIRMGADEQAAFRLHWAQLGATPLIGWVDTWAGQFPGLAHLGELPAPYATASRVPCADLWFKLVVNHKGDAVICCHDWSYSTPMGTVLSSDWVEQTWRGSRLAELRGAHAVHDFSCSRLCKGCREWGELGELDAYTTLDDASLPLVF